MEYKKILLTHFHQVVPYGNIPDSKVQGANMGPTWVLSDPGGRHVGLINHAIMNRYGCSLVQIMA